MKGLADYARNDYSQCGEDGILERLFDLLAVPEGWCVEFGAWDGVHLSNTHALIRNRNWRGVLIEADAQKFTELERNMRPFAGVTCVNRLIDYEGANSLDRVLAACELPREFELLCIDIDGNDYHVWDSVTEYRPKVVVIEYNPTIPNHVEFVQKRDPSVRQGNSLLALTKLGKAKGYELSAATTANGIFVRRDLFPRTGLDDNSIDAVRPDHQFHTTLFQLYDGTLVLDGFTHLLWHDAPIPQEKIQVVPRLLRCFPGNASPRMLRLQRSWRRLERVRRVVRRRIVSGHYSESERFCQ